MVQIRLSPFLEERIGWVRCLEVSVTTARSALEALTDRHPQLTRSIWIREGMLNPIMAVFLNDDIWKVLHDGVRYVEHGPAVTPIMLKRRRQRLVTELRKLGYQVELTPVQPSLEV